MSNRLDELMAKAKEAIGNLTGDRETEREGEAEQVAVEMERAAKGDDQTDSHQQDPGDQPRHG